MKHRRLSSNEFNLIFVAFIILFLILMLFSDLFIIFNLIISFLWLIRYSLVKFLSRKLPGKSIWRSRRLMEVHISGLAKGNAFEFVRINMDSIISGLKQNKDVVFYSWHRSPKDFDRLFGKYAEIKEVKGFERFAQLFGNKHYKKKDVKYPLTKVYIHFNRVDEHGLNHLKRFAKIRSQE